MVGHSGCGKSTVLNLICGFYKADKGSIKLYGSDIEHWNLTSLREQLALVSQDVYLYPGSIEDNIKLGKMNSTHEDIVAAAQKANAHNFIMKLPKGYDTNVSESGTNLSGGQKQCISIARAFVKDAPILLFDEATSALDSESEQLVQKGLDTLFKGRTVLIIAHRLATIKNASIIYLIRDGKVYEAGTHNELMSKSGIYKKLYNIQFA